MKTSPETHVPLSSDFPHYPEAEMQARAIAYHEQMQSRRSVRSFSSKPVPQDIIEQCVLTAGTAPSGAKHQPWYFACVGSTAKKKEIREAAEAEEREFYSGRAAQEWIDALAPIGTDADKPYMEIASWLICIFAGPGPSLRRRHISFQSENQINHGLEAVAAILEKRRANEGGVDRL